ncbi:beta-ketoacyl-[acyl-carrier-protein] synthase family protein [Mucilaginibacter sp. RS28]|uniref:Beta-ketoacyl-[acyl-carrier-protein] synthase family protein n=1 Tax=Mucilaginibacter straminoryzae TaxID=2932774 RepID=A0A9X1X8X1_9SPHI|nr:beta-ketoacyl-[acyl-carrier-protein] synthase family protein [Mucilaginibacter straminoryzae]MCJ8210559.1 beta-ketoacyl-[acyl-carrier-protein] synthase family protein [Mucilaginibacter straminoryzae]
MAKQVYIIADNIYSPLGATTAQNFDRLKHGTSAVKIHTDKRLSDMPVAAAVFAPDDFPQGEYTKFEQLLIASIEDALKNTAVDPRNPRTGLVISSTKGNISLIENHPYDSALKKRVDLGASAALIAQRFGFTSQPIVICNACVSGVMAILTAARMIESGRFENVVVAGADVVSKFVVSGFQSFQALSSEVCKPFDKDRNGLNLGEGAATVILSESEQYKGRIRVSGGGITNDANHISGPSRTGQELADAIASALKTAGVQASEIDMVSVHGTATPYNDEMEANALTLAGLQHSRVTGIKGYYGHTLGAAGLIEAVISLKCMEDSLVLPTLGFTNAGTKPLQVTTKLEEVKINHCLKTASGFGGCNAAMILSK